MFKRILPIILMFMLSPFAVFFSGTTQGAEEYPRNLAEVLDRIASTAAGIETLAGDFIQEKHADILDSDLRTKGRFYFERPDILLWEQTEPFRSGFLAKGTEVWVWKGSAPRQAIELDNNPGISIFKNHVLACMKADFEWLSQKYRISLFRETPLSLMFIPRHGSNRTKEMPLEHILVVFSPDLTHAKKVEIHEKNGDFIRIKFLNTKVNIPRREDLCEP